MPDVYLAKGGVAHDLKGLITRACLAIDMLEQHKDDAVRNQAVRISRALERVASICLREFEAPLKPTAPRMHDAHDIKCLVREVVSTARIPQDVAQNPLLFKIVVNPDVRIKTDSLPLFRILYNLVSNAANAMTKSGGEVLSIQVRKARGYVLFDVVDDGPGLPECVLDYLYPRANAAPRRMGRIGAGLVTAVSLAKDLQGELALLRTGDDGTAFQFKVPAFPAEKADTCRPPHFPIVAQTELGAHMFVAE